MVFYSTFKCLPMAIPLYLEIYILVTISNYVQDQVQGNFGQHVDFQPSQKILFFGFNICFQVSRFNPGWIIQFVPSTNLCFFCKSSLPTFIWSLTLDSSINQHLFQVNPFQPLVSKFYHRAINKLILARKSYCVFVSSQLNQLNNSFVALLWSFFNNSTTCFNIQFYHHIFFASNSIISISTFCTFYRPTLFFSKMSHKTS